MQFIYVLPYRERGLQSVNHIHLTIQKVIFTHRFFLSRSCPFKNWTHVNRHLYCKEGQVLPSFVLEDLITDKEYSAASAARGGPIFACEGPPTQVPQDYGTQAHSLPPCASGPSEIQAGSGLAFSHVGGS